MLHLGEAFEPCEFRRLHRAEFADFTEVIAEQIGDHHQFSQFLGAGLEFVS